MSDGSLQKRVPREFKAALTGALTGVLDNRPDAFMRTRPDVEVIRVREVLPESEATSANLLPEGGVFRGDVVCVGELEPVAPTEIGVGAPADARQVDVSAACAQAVETALTDLARELGCFYSTDIPKNSGLFVPGTPRAQENARAAILALFDHVRQGGLMMRPMSPEILKALGLQKMPAAAEPAPPAAPEPKAAPAQPQAEAPAAEQIGLF
ncbi:hypothetical protein [Cupriavidus pauculus]|uniref:hypothetical protein n=1 Tax=Cupriavidus pauculus TaxID=82633 RepID=UPI001D0CA60D|nr:hypothetical protein [Cupriavidus pauculus]